MNYDLYTPWILRLIWCFVLFCICYKWLRFRIIKKRMIRTVEAVAQEGQNEIGEHPVEYWLDILNQNATQEIGAYKTKVFIYEGHDFFFVNGGTFCLTKPSTRVYDGFQRAFFLIAVGQSAVKLLSEQDRIFRRISGSDELAAFSVYRYSDFTDSLLLKGGRRIGPG